MILALIFLLFLPAMGFTGDVEITRVELKWWEESASGRAFTGEIRVKNDSDTDYSVMGKLIFYDGDNLPRWPVYFMGGVKAGKNKVFHVRGWLMSDIYRDVTYYEATIDLKAPQP